MGEWLHSGAVGAPASPVLDVCPRAPEARRGVGAHGCAGRCFTPRRPTPQPCAPTPRRASGARGQTSSTGEAGAPTAPECNHSPMSTESETQPSAGPVGHATERPAVAPVGEVELEVEADADAEPWTDAEPWVDAEPWPAADRAPSPPLPSDRFGDRELDWLAFNQRVLELAEDT